MAPAAHARMNLYNIFVEAHMARALVLDELSLGTKAKSRAKPDKFSIRFYGISGAVPGIPPYLFSYAFNGAGDTTNKSLPEKHIDLNR